LIIVVVDTKVRMVLFLIVERDVLVRYYQWLAVNVFVIIVVFQQVHVVGQ